MQSAVFPGVQGSIHTQVIAAKAVCLGEALQPEFRVYAHQVKKNAARLAAVLAEGGLSVVTGGTDTHIVLLDLSHIGMTGQAAERVLERPGAGDEAQRIVARLCRSFPLGMRTHDGVALLRPG